MDIRGCMGNCNAALSISRRKRELVANNGCQFVNRFSSRDYTRALGIVGQGLKMLWPVLILASSCSLFPPCGSGLKPPQGNEHRCLGVLRTSVKWTHRSRLFLLRLPNKWRSNLLRIAKKRFSTISKQAPLK